MVRGTVTSYDPARGVASVRLDDGRRASMHTAAFLSGRPARHPSKGDRISCQVRDSRPPRVVAARPVREA